MALSNQDRVLEKSENTTSTGTLTLGKGSWLALTDTVNL